MTQFLLTRCALAYTFSDVTVTYLLGGRNGARKNQKHITAPSKRDPKVVVASGSRQRKKCKPRDHDDLERGDEKEEVVQ
ncbi:hypothetical protein ACSZMZ_05975 [Aeromonas veronii]